MKIAVLSGKGGTGKTFVSVNLATILENSIYADCDVEEPNGELFLSPNITDNEKVSILIPQFNQNKCIGCKKCVDNCKFHALAFIKNTPLLFTEVCHSCGVCSYVCKSDAINEIKKQVGIIQIGKVKNMQFLSGKMNLKEVSGVPIIKKILEKLPDDKDVVIDCPPGSGCAVMESIKDADYCLIVAEPTEYGKENLDMVNELVTVFKKPYSVILNKDMKKENPVETYCKENKIEIIAKIPFDREIAKKNGSGDVLVEIDKNINMTFNNILEKIKEQLSK